ncbi:Zinc carboxypeptidase A 1 [Pseudolycoriella hygida]|uniref:Zinc carboxypeptidase A 1 n=1 Tax=Pseudolycoriella hygida TaxID=35572 RepID=A0A9Q0MI56_9DIPT|nr:Zinc carboxypeptidase A 1 [Pseudolycoriella hygida]
MYMIPWIVGLLLILMVGVTSEYKVSYTDHKLYELYFEGDFNTDIRKEIFGHQILGYEEDHGGSDIALLVRPDGVHTLNSVLQNNKVGYTVHRPSTQRLIDKESKNIKRLNGSGKSTDFEWQNYHELETIYAWLDSLAVKYKGLVKVFSIGQSYEGRPIKGVKLSHKEGNTAVVIEAGMNSDELLMPSTATFLLNQLLTATEERIQYVAKNFDWIVFPVCNPDGYKYAIDFDRLWRKNRQSFGKCFGVDLNRNFNASWIYDIYKERSPCDIDYAGSNPFSAPETAALAAYLSSSVETERIKTYLSFHFGLQNLLLPYAAKPAWTSNHIELLEVGYSAAKASTSRYNKFFAVGTYFSLIFEATKGTSLDWVHSELNVPVVFIYNSRRHYKNAPARILPAGQIIKAGYETLDGVVELITTAEQLGFYDSPDLSKNETLRWYWILLIVCLVALIAILQRFKMIPWIVRILLILTVGVASETKVRYDDYKFYEIHLERNLEPDVQQEITRHIVLDHESTNVTVLIAPNKVINFDTLLAKYNVSHEILNVNIQQLIDAESKRIKRFNASAKGTDFGWKSYYELETIYAWLDHLAEKYSDVVTLINIGKSFEGRPIKGVKLSHDKENTVVFIEAGMHSEEWASPAVATYILDQLLTSTNSIVQHFAKYFNWIVVPVCNPDGYKYTFDKDRLWRKNRQPFFRCYGVDLNRNFNVSWAFNSPYADSCSNNYPGPSAFSAPETTAIATYLRKNAESQRIKTYLSFHAASQNLQVPYAADRPHSPNFNDLLKIGNRAGKGFSKYRKQLLDGTYFALNYGARGTSLDWAYKELNVPIVFLYDLRRSKIEKDNPPFLLPADKIEATGLETLGSVVILLNESKVLGYYDSETLIRIWHIFVILLCSKMIHWIFRLLLIITIVVASELPVRYDEYKLYDIHLVPIPPPRIKKEIFGHIIIRHRGETKNITILVPPDSVQNVNQFLKNNKISHQILVICNNLMPESSDIIITSFQNDNFQRLIDDDTKNVKRFNHVTKGKDFGWRKYHELETIDAWLDNLAVKYKGLVTVFSVGESYEGRPIKGVKLSHKNGNTAVFIEGGIHGMEWISPATVTFILNQLLTSTDPLVRYVAENFDWIVVPVCNPDGYKYAFDWDRLWRKNREPMKGCTGVDLNRNWDNSRSFKNLDTCSNIYPGPHSQSAPETKALATYLRENVESQRIKTYLSFHAGTQKILFPYTSNKLLIPNFSDLTRIGREASYALSKRYGKKFKVGSYASLNFAARGTSLDWVYSELDIKVAYVYKLRRSATRKGESDYLLPADEIEAAGWETLDSVVALLKSAESFGYYGDMRMEESVTSFLRWYTVAVVMAIVLFILYFGYAFNFFDARNRSICDIVRNILGCLKNVFQ